MTIGKCTRKNFCKYCDNSKCFHAGKRRADCPKYECDNPRYEDCGRCSFLKKWYKEMEEK